SSKTSNLDATMAAFNPPPSSRAAGLLKGLGRHPGWVLAGVLVLLALGFAAFKGWHWLRDRRDLEAAEADLERKQFSAAYAKLATYLENHPDDADVQFLAARTARRAHRTDEAKAHLAEFSRLGGNSEKVALERALLQAQAG